MFFKQKWALAVVALLLFPNACSSKDNTQRDIADLLLYLTENGPATIIFKNEKTDPACDYELEISSGGVVKLNIPATATGTTSSPRNLEPGVYDFALHCDATGAKIDALQNQTIERRKTYEFHAEVTSTFELTEVQQ